MFFKGKTAIVTGGASGIGKATCVAFAERGCNVALNDKNKIEQSLVDELQSKGVKVLPYQCDVGKFDECGKFIDTVVKELGPVEYLVNNAGIIRDNMIKRMTEEDWDIILETDLKSVFNMTRHIYPVFEAQGTGGSIINMTSATAYSANIGQANYGAAKAGVMVFTKHTAREFAKIGVTANALAPGFIVTAITEPLQGEARERYLNNIPLKRAGDPEEVAHAVMFFCEARYITGQILHVNGGLLMPS